MTLFVRRVGPNWAAALSLSGFVLICGSTSLRAAKSAADLRNEVAQHEAAGDLAGAQSILKQEAGTAGNAAAAEELAEFLDRHRSAESREAYLQWVAAETDPSKKKLALRQIVLDDLISGKTSELNNDLNQYRAAGGTDLAAPASRSKSGVYSTVMIPGPLPSFARMAALAPDLAPEDLLPALARNVVTNGFEASGNELLQPTEYLRLLTRYIGQARELQALANKDHKIVIPNCDSTQTGDLLKVLGYRMRGTCGADIVLETVNATRAFLTVDSAFPLTQLEQDLRANHPFELSYGPTTVPVLYNSQYWLSAAGRSNGGDFIDAFLSDPSLCRLYLGLSHLDRQTAEVLRKQAPPAKLKIYAHVLDFYGGMFQIRNGAAVVPGPPKIWASLTGASPSNPGAFFEKLIATDDGWLASYFDALSRIDGPTAAYLTSPDHLRRFYDALRGKVTSPGPARPVFRSSTELMLLTTSLRIDANGEPHVPGDLEVWQNLFIKHPHGKYDGKLTRSATNWKNSDDLLDALFGLSRKTVENEPLRMFLALNDIDRNRVHPISPQLATRLISSYRAYNAQYVVFADAPALSEASIQQYLNLFGESMGIRNALLRSDSLGTLQSLVELWRILCRQDSIQPAKQDAVFAKLIAPFSQSNGEAELFSAGRSGVDLLLSATQSGSTGTRQERLTELLVGRVQNEGRVTSPAENFLHIFDAQSLIPLDSLFALADHLANKSVDPKLLKSVNQQLNRLEEAESVKDSLSSQEKNFYSVGYWSERHIEQEHKLNLEELAKSPEKKDPRGALAPLLRDTLVGLVYCYYAPTGAQVLITNPVFVRSHDFIGPEGLPAEWRATEVAGSGWPANSGGRLTGSLISLPYALAEAEQNFLTPRREQALIWADLVPQMIVDVTVNRWRGVTPQQVRWVDLHLQRGQDLLAASVLDPSVEPQILDSIRRFEAPGRVEAMTDELHAGDFARGVAEVPTSVLYELADDPALKSVAPDIPAQELTSMAAEKSPELSPQTISHVFGTPKPTLTHSYRPGLLYLRTFPALMGYSSRILAESWESNNLYFAGLADQAGVPVQQLDAYVPEWNRSAIENIFATHLEDWPAILRSLQTVGKEVRQQANPPVTIAKSENQ
ncbi:MAG: hypothetical protein JO210_16730 [Acidobacteriaceae bacterium]|nr:hypothetical protein [Acidobacteriaceae bacterium]